MNTTTNTKRFAFIALLAVLAASMACVNEASFEAANIAGNGTPLPGTALPTETLIPAYIATSQNAVAGAQATTAKGQARMSELSVNSTEVSLALTVAAATEQHSITQTAAVRQETERAHETLSAQATASAEVAILATKTAYAQATVDTQATNDAIVRDSQNAVIVANSQAEVERIEEQRESERQTMLFRTWGYRVFWSIMAGLLVVALGMMLRMAWLHRNAILTRLGVYKWGPDGKPYMPVSTNDGGVVILDPSRLLGPAIRVAPDGTITQPGILDVPIQARLASQAQLIELVLAAATGQRQDARRSPFRTASSAMSLANKTNAALPADIKVLDDDAASLPPIAPWDLLKSWNDTAMPLGIGREGPIKLDPYGIAPHLLIAGTTGSGKTFKGTRPAIASALAMGRQAIIIARSGPGMGIFKSHPNVVYRRIDSAEDAIHYMHVIYNEVIRRNRILEDANCYNWEQLQGAYGPEIVVSMDEFSNLADELTKSGREDLWRWTRMVAAEGRKAGILLILALQDPTRASIDLRIRRNCTKVAFPVQERESSQVVLGSPGAEKLDPATNQFLALVNGLVRGVAFAPQDKEISAFLNSKPVKTCVPATWLDDEVIDAKAAPIWSDEVIQMAEAIRPGWEEHKSQGKIISKRQAARLAGGEYGGSFCPKVDRALEYLETH